MRNKLLTLQFTLSLFLFPIFIAAQALSLSVQDDTGQAIPYATVYLPALEKGLITDENGAFRLNNINVTDTTTVSFSAVGYETTRISYQKLLVLETQGEAVVMPKATYTLAAIEVADKRLRLRQQKLGLPGLLNATYEQSTRSRPMPIEAGPIIRPGKRCRLDAVELKVKKMDADTALLDINVYALKGRKVKEQLLRERLFVSVTKQEVGRNLTVDLTAQDLWIEGDFLITFRLLKVIGTEGGFAFKGKTGSKYGLIRQKGRKWEKGYLTPALFAKVSYEK